MEYQTQIEAYLQHVRDLDDQPLLHDVNLESVAEQGWRGMVEALRRAPKRRAVPERGVKAETLLLAMQPGCGSESMPAAMPNGVRTRLESVSYRRYRNKGEDLGRRASTICGRLASPTCSERSCSRRDGTFGHHTAGTTASASL